MMLSQTYHIYTHANGSENLFRNDENFGYFLKRYQDFIPAVADTLAWCLMPNHLHLVVRVKEERELKEFFKNRKDLTGLERLTILQFSHLFNAYTKAYNKVYNRRGSLFTRAFRRRPVTSDDYLTSVIHYIHLNPVHHGFAANLTDWPWSSYHELLLPELTPTQQAVIDWFGSKEQFILAHQKRKVTMPEIIT